MVRLVTFVDQFVEEHFLCLSWSFFLLPESNKLYLFYKAHIRKIGKMIKQNILRIR
jgi:hypothetical protein